MSSLWIVSSKMGAFEVKEDYRLSLRLLLMRGGDVEERDRGLLY